MFSLYVYKIELFFVSDTLRDIDGIYGRENWTYTTTSNSVLTYSEGYTCTNWYVIFLVLLLLQKAQIKIRQLLL